MAFFDSKGSRPLICGHPNTWNSRNVTVNNLISGQLIKVDGILHMQLIDLVKSTQICVLTQSNMRSIGAF